MMIPIKKITPSVPNASITVGSFKYALTLVEYTAACSIIAPNWEKTLLSNVNLAITNMINPSSIIITNNNISLIKETLEDEFIGMIRKPNCEITTQDNVTKLFDIDE